MSAIDELKDGVVIDTTSDASEGVIIDSTDDNSVNRVDLSNLNRSDGNHQFVRPNLNKNDNTRSAQVKKSVVNIDAIPTVEVEEETHVSPTDDLINPENPNSLFSQYVKEKEEEAREWIAQRQDEAEVMQDEIEINTTDKVVEYVDSSAHKKLVIDDDLDLSRLDGNKEEKIAMEESVMPPKELEKEIEIDADIIKEDEEEITDEYADILEENTDEEIEDDGMVSEESSVIGEVVEEKEVFDAPDIEVEESDSQTFVTDIEEDEDNKKDQVAATDEEEVLKKLQKLATEKLKPVSKKLDISSFTVLKKPTANVNPIFNESSARVVKWVLPSQDSIVLMKEFSGSELEKMREYSENSRSVDSLNRRFHMIYDHIVSPKPATFEQWLKTTPYEDVDHYFFAIYVASFKGANYLPEDCGNKNCGETFITDDINIMDMVKFDTEEAKEKFTKLYQSESTPAGKGVYCTEVVPMSNNIAIAFREPSIYNVFEIASIDDRTRSAYSAIIDYIPYIDTIYGIDVEAKTLTPITYKMFPDNAQRTIKSKVQKYDKLFSSLSVDEFGPVKAYIRAITEKSTGMHYVYPAVECPKCHTLTEERTVRAEELVFTRYQLGSLVTTSLN